MKHSILAIAMTMLLTGCAGFGWNSVEPVKIKKEEVSRTPLNIPDPAPIKPTAPNWIVITPSTAERVWKQMETNNQDLVLFALSDDGYEALAVDTAATRNYIARLRQILQEYRNYYEPVKPDAGK